MSTGSVLGGSRTTSGPDIQIAADTGPAPTTCSTPSSKDIPIGSDGLIINEYFQGNPDAHPLEGARNHRGLSLMHTPAHMYHAIQESVCYGTAHNLRAMTDAGWRSARSPPVAVRPRART